MDNLARWGLLMAQARWHQDAALHFLTRPDRFRGREAEAVDHQKQAERLYELAREMTVMRRCSKLFPPLCQAQLRVPEWPRL